jgi:hypothetical protein
MTLIEDYEEIFDHVESEGERLLWLYINAKVKLLQYHHPEKIILPNIETILKNLKNKKV